MAPTGVSSSRDRTQVERVKEMNKVFDRQRGHLLQQRGDRKVRSKRLLTTPSHLTCQTISPLAQAISCMNRLPFPAKQESTEEKFRTSSRYKDIPMEEFLYGAEQQEAEEWLPPKYQKRLENICRRKSPPKPYHQREGQN